VYTSSVLRGAPYAFFLYIKFHLLIKIYIYIYIYIYLPICFTKKKKKKDKRKRKRKSRSGLSVHIVLLECWGVIVTILNLSWILYNK